MAILPQSRGSRSSELDIRCVFSASNVNVYANVCVKHSTFPQAPPAMPACSSPNLTAHGCSHTLPLSPYCTATRLLHTDSSTSAVSELQRDISTEISTQAGILAACEPDIEALTRAEGLREVIAQVKSGQVAAIRMKYGPQKRRATDLMWGRIKGAVTRRERLYALFEKEFGGDEDRFFDFFGREWRKGDQQDSLQAFWPVVQAIPHMEMDLAAEKTKSEYQDDSGNFSEAIWRNRWEGLNKMEIWRAIGKEDYRGRK
jgi:hypothetical protein